jgi:uncharacterized membrane protein YkoI
MKEKAMRGAYMKRNYWFWLGGGVVVLAILFLIIVQFIQPISTATALTEQEAENIAEKRYSGTVKQIHQEENEYVIEFERDSGLYELKIQSLTGEVSSLKMLKEKKKPEGPSEDLNDPVLLKEEEIKSIALKEVNGELESIHLLPEGDIPSYQVIMNEKDKKTTLSIDARLGDILKKETVNVTPTQKRLTIEEANNLALKEVPGVVDDVDEELINGISHYFVKIESPNDREAIVEINTITGEVASITWDDEGDD